MLGTHSGAIASLSTAFTCSSAEFAYNAHQWTLRAGRRVECGGTVCALRRMRQYALIVEGVIWRAADHIAR